MMNHMTSMVGPMPMHGEMAMSARDRRQPGSRLLAFEPPAGGDMSNSLGMITRGPALSEEHGAHFGRGMGEQTGSEREVRNGMHVKHTDDGRTQVPGYPQDMMDMHGMHSESDLKRINKPETRGMRHNWYTGVEGLMTVLRVLPPDLYDKVMSGEGEVPPGASVPGDTGAMHGHKH
jgi:manganese oxidase